MSSNSASSSFARASSVAAAALALAVLGQGAVHAGGGGGTSSGSGDEVAGEVLLMLRSNDALAPLMQKYQLSLVSRFGSRPIYRLKVIGSAKAKDKVAAMSLETDVVIAEVNTVQRNPEARRNVAWAIGTPEAFAAQWAPQAIRLGEAQALATGAGVRVAVLDTGVDRTHPALAARLLPGFDFVDYDNDPSEMGSTSNIAYGHGTHVAGLIAMAAPGASIMPLRVLDADGQGNAWVLAEALLYAVDPDGNPQTDDGAHVINLSLGSLARTRFFDTIAQLVTCESTAADISDAGYDSDRARCKSGRGAVIVAAAGNGASSGEQQYPAAEGYNALISVAASNAQGRLASFSNWGSWIRMAAPGDAITSTVPGGWGTWSGTSMAAPLVAATAALLRGIEPTMAPRDVVQRILRTSTSLCGTGLRQLDAAGALRNTTPQLRSCP